jgi:hypothetical protein
MNAPGMIGSYSMPAVSLGEEVLCLYREEYCRITSITAARIQWPRCRPIKRNAGSNSLYVDETLKRAILTESALALSYWFGVSPRLVSRWRKGFGVTSKFGTEGSKRLNRAASAKRAAAVRGKKLDLSAEERKKRARRGRKMMKRLRKEGTLNPDLRPWTKEELALLGTMPDRDLAARLERSYQSVRRKRKALGIAPPEKRPWTPEEDAIIRDGTAREVAERLGRSVTSVQSRREVLNREKRSG